MSYLGNCRILRQFQTLKTVAQCTVRTTEDSRRVKESRIIILRVLVILYALNVNFSNGFNTVHCRKVVVCRGSFHSVRWINRVCAIYSFAVKVFIHISHLIYLKVPKSSILFFIMTYWKFYSWCIPICYIQWIIFQIW